MWQNKDTYSVKEKFWPVKYIVISSRYMISGERRFTNKKVYKQIHWTEIITIWDKGDETPQDQVGSLLSGDSDTCH